MQFNPEDNELGGPRCRNCHRGSSGCGGCHNNNGGVNPATFTAPSDQALAASNVASDYSTTQMARSDITHFLRLVNNDPNAVNSKAYTVYNLTRTSDGQPNEISVSLSDATYKTQMFKSSRTVAWSDYRTSPNVLAASCSDDGFSWPHRTLGYMMLKDDLFGLNFDGTQVGAGDYRTTPGIPAPGYKAHDIDSVCLDCHNPTIFNATSTNDHIDDKNNPNDDFDDDVFLRGLP